MSQTATIPFILALAIEDPSQQTFNEPLLSKIGQKSNLKCVTTAQEAIDLIDGDASVQAVFVIDSGPTLPQHKAVSDRIVQFVQNGGTVVLGGSFSSFVRPQSLNTYFNTKWGLPWRAGSYQRTTVSLNQDADIGPRHSLVSSYSQKALFLTEVENRSAWYLPTEDTSETPIAFVKSGNGWLGYIGDVNAEDGTDNVVLGMIGLL